MHSRASGSASAPESSDPLAAVIQLLRPETVLSKIVSGGGRFCVRYAAHQHPSFGIVLDGACFIDAEGIGMLRLEAGDFILLPATPGFTIGTDLTVKPRVVAPTDDDVRYGKKRGAPSLRMLGGYFSFDRANAELLVRFLPSVIVIRRRERGAARLRRLVKLIADEAPERRPGRDLVLERLVEVLLVEALRFRAASTAEHERGFFAGLSDPALSGAFRCMHDDAARAWTVAELARAAGMSRAVFAERFALKVGLPPMRYLLEWRLALAKNLLRRERLPLAEVAETIGYRSASAFSTAFTRHVGCPPSEFARSAGARARS
jgi:AraC-like DNA-binding protein